MTTGDALSASATTSLCKSTHYMISKTVHATVLIILITCTIPTYVILFDPVGFYTCEALTQIFESIRFDSILFDAIRFNTILFDSIYFYATSAAGAAWKACLRCHLGAQFGPNRRCRQEQDCDRSCFIERSMVRSTNVLLSTGT